MKKRNNLLLTLFMLALCAASVHAQTVDEIMEKHMKAIGGAENWDKVKTMKMTGVMAQPGMDINICQTIEVGKAMRMDITVMGMSGFQIITATQGWMYMPFQGTAKIDTMKPELVKVMQQQLDVKSRQLLNYKADGNTAEYKGIDTVNNQPCYKIRFKDKDGNESLSFFDQTSYYLLRTESKIKQDDQEAEVAVLFNDYKKQDAGIFMPMSVTAQGAEITFKSIEINKPIDESVFIPALPSGK